MFRNFRRVPVREQAIRAKIFVHVDEMRLALRLFSRSAHARLAITNDPRAVSIQPASISGRNPRITEVG